MGQGYLQMKMILIWILVLILLILHQDYWQWDRNEIVAGFMPYTMAYNIGISIATGLMWIVVCAFLWPAGLDDLQSPPEGNMPRKPVKDQ